MQGKRLEKQKYTYFGTWKRTTSVTKIFSLPLQQLVCVDIKTRWDKQLIPYYQWLKGTIGCLLCNDLLHLWQDREGLIHWLHGTRSDRISLMQASCSCRSLVNISLFELLCCNCQCCSAQFTCKSFCKWLPAPIGDSWRGLQQPTSRLGSQWHWHSPASWCGLNADASPQAWHCISQEARAWSTASLAP